MVRFDTVESFQVGFETVKPFRVGFETVESSRVIFETVEFFQGLSLSYFDKMGGYHLLL